MSTEIVINGTKLLLVEGNITAKDTDAIVNAANSSLMGGGGVDGAIHRMAGPAILEECKRIRAELGGPLPTGEAVITTGGDLKARHVIHTVGPVWYGGTRGEPELLANAYRNSLRLAVDTGLRTVSFPSISTGAHGYPVDKAAEVALRAVLSLLEENTLLDEVIFVLFDSRTFRTYQETLERLRPEQG